MEVNEAMRAHWERKKANVPQCKKDERIKIRDFTLNWLLGCVKLNLFFLFLECRFQMRLAESFYECITANVEFGCDWTKSKRGPSTVVALRLCKTQKCCSRKDLLLHIVVWNDIAPLPLVKLKPCERQQRPTDFLVPAINPRLLWMMLSQCLLKQQWWPARQKLQADSGSLQSPGVCCGCCPFLLLQFGGKVQTVPPLITDVVKETAVAVD